MLMHYDEVRKRQSYKEIVGVIKIFIILLFFEAGISGTAFSASLRFKG